MINDVSVQDEDKMLCAAAYAIGVFSLYIILTEKRKDRFAGFHGSQALFLWIGIIVFWLASRVILDMIYSIVYLPFLNSLAGFAGLLMWIYALYCAYRAYMGEYFTIPYISDLVHGVEK